MRCLLAAIAIVAIPAMPLSVIAADACFAPLSKEEIVAQAVFTCLCLIDWSQTIEIAQHPESNKESNPILGHHPSIRRVNALIPLGIATHALITWTLPREYRKYWQYVWIGVEAQAVHVTSSATSVLLHGSGSQAKQGDARMMPPKMHTNNFMNKYYITKLSDCPAWR